MKVKEFFRSFTVFEYLLWGGSVIAIVLSFFLCGNTKWWNLVGSLLGACMLILTAKGNVIGQVLSLAFSVYYGCVSYFMHYYGELITYVCMSAPMAIAVMISWLRHPYRGNRSEVTVNKLKLWEYPVILALAAAVTVVFYFILAALHTENVAWSTVSVTTSFIAVAFTLRRSPYYALGYALNDIVLIVLWSLASRTDPENLSLVVCFAVFLANDLYGLYNWLRMHKRQARPGY